jgi:hypothetical protein
VGNSVYFCLTSIGDTCSLELNEVIETEKAKLNKEYEEIVSIIQHDREIAVKKDSSIKVTIKKDSEAAKAFESLREDKQEFKENVQSGKIMPPHIKEKIDKLTDELKKVYELAEESWEGCDGCDENDKYFFIKGFQTGYNRAKPDELSDEEIREAAKYYLSIWADDEKSFVEGAKWYREQLKQRQ